MSQHDLNIANQTAPNTRSDINNALQALGSNNSGSSAPSTTYANMHWYDTSSNILKQRSEADDAWISIGYFDQSTNSFKILDNTIVANTSGTQTGIIGDQSTATWQAGTGTTQSLVSPASVKAAIDAQVSTKPLMLVQDEVSSYSATNYGNSTWQTTTLNTIKINSISGSVGSNNITLPAGSYYVEYSLPVARVASDTADLVGSRLRNTTASSNAIVGQSMKIGDWQNLNFMGAGEFTISGTSNFELQVYSNEGIVLRYGNVPPSQNAVFAIVKIFRA
jgi:hypothetical protein